MFGGEPDLLRFALEATGDPRAAGTLVTLIRENKIAQENLPNVAKTITALGQAGEIDFVLTLTKNQPSLLKPISMGAKYNGATPGRPDSVVALLGHAEPSIREAAAELAGRWKIQAAIEPLAKRILEAPETAERLNAARALARLGDLERLRNFTAPGQARAVRIAAISAGGSPTGERRQGSHRDFDQRHRTGRSRWFSLPSLATQTEPANWLTHSLKHN